MNCQSFDCGVLGADCSNCRPNYKSPNFKISSMSQYGVIQLSDVLNELKFQTKLLTELKNYIDTITGFSSNVRGPVIEPKEEG